MTAASRHHSPLSPRGFLSQRLERIALLLVVCVPVPALALSGLNVPLPSIVERAAAALVPWANVATLDADALAATRGSIVHAAGQGSEANAVARAGGKPPAQRSAPPRTQARYPLPTVRRVDETLARSRTEAPAPDKSDRRQVTPIEPPSDEGGHDNPAPGPLEPTPAPEPAPPEEQPSGNVPTTPPAPPTPAPTPDRSPKDRDEKPVDETDVTPTLPPVPADETEVLPPVTDTTLPDEKKVDPDLPPAEDVLDQLPGGPSSPRNDRSNADGSGK